MADIVAVAPLLGEAVARLRAGRVIREAGYDGEYGAVRLFQPDELGHLGRGAAIRERLFVAISKYLSHRN